jgi:hypothetical protein
MGNLSEVKTIGVLNGIYLYLAHQNQNHNDQQHRADTTARPITPVAAMTPCRKHSYQRQHQNQQKNHSDTHLLLLVSISPYCFSGATATSENFAPPFFLERLSLGLFPLAGTAGRQRSRQ